ncbi:hypothetical protein DSOL_2231 [Desulfosporosinus metallidurans]|uniref:Uncharacterized protein n=1 Tax=Desulfosporosinus metallidurans TaxID=1888891 RepID=A0A1Q8QX81_9FIRM|nr:hypothetical protein DSOL_2231 [Desulfosporosinus metallidurans]
MIHLGHVSKTVIGDLGNQTEEPSPCLGVTLSGKLKGGKGF